MGYLSRIFDGNLGRFRPRLNTAASKNSPSGFTIVELLVVIVVIGILAAITTVGYSGIQNRTNDTAVKGDLSQMAKKAALYYVEEGEYPPSSWFFSNVKASKQSYDTSLYNFYYCTDKNSPRTNFGIAARSTSRQTFTISSTSGIGTSVNAPSWGVACGAYGETVLGNVTFDYGYHFVNGAWKPTL